MGPIFNKDCNPRLKSNFLDYFTLLSIPGNIEPNFQKKKNIEVFFRE